MAVGEDEVVDVASEVAAVAEVVGLRAVQSYFLRPVKGEHRRQIDEVEAEHENGSQLPTVFVAVANDRVDQKNSGVGEAESLQDAQYPH